ncbi:MAG: hypothetical protein E5V28_02100 [Mesorhizobium sp.]|nr:MAG: hypothetical protein E5V28_02100 [Mesorhizobium sp.]TIX80161.1 MAG: hypothetical protein E5V27_20170 [Mesorhizobium sp.]
MKAQRTVLNQQSPVAEWGRRSPLGVTTLGAKATAEAIDEEVRSIVDTAFARTVGLLTERRDLLEKTARKLLEIETLSEAELASLVGNVSAPGSHGAIRTGIGQATGTTRQGCGYKLVARVGRS